MQELQETVRTPTLRDDARMVQGRPPQGLPAAPMNRPAPQAPIPQFIPDEIMSMDVKQNLNEVLTATLPDGDSIAAKALEGLVQRAGVLVQGMVEISQQPPEQAMEGSGGGLMGFAAQEEFKGKVPGEGHGMEDNVYMPIKEEGEEIGTLAVTPKEYVVDAHTMSALGNGNADEGADVMDEVVESVREKAYGTNQQPKQINGLAALRPMMERV